MKKRTTQTYSILLASMLGVSSVVPASMMPVMAQTVRASATRTYAEGEMVSVNGGEGAIDASSDVSAFVGLEDFTFNATFTVTGSSVNSLFFLGDSTRQNNYITVYVNGHTIGVESRDASGAQQISGATVTLNDVDFSQQHKLTFTMDGGNLYRIYLDGEMVKEGSVSVNFSAGLFDSADYMGFGNGKRANGGNPYPLTGSIGDIELYDSALSEEDILSYHRGELGNAVYTYENAYGESVNDTEGLSAVKDLTQGSISVRYRINDPADGPMMLMAVSDGTQDRSYLGLYVNPASNQLGFDAPGNALFSGKTLDLSRYGKSIADTSWHTLTVTKADGGIRFYLDGEYLDQYTNGITSGFFNTVSSPDSLGIGYVNRATGNEMALDGAIDYVNVYGSVLSESEIALEHETTAWEPDQAPDMSNAYKSDPIDLYYTGYQNVTAYRIPSLLTTSAGTQLAFIDERNSGAGDAGNIDAVVRRKSADSDTFSAPITLIDLPNNGGSAAFTIDASAVQDQETGRIFMLIDMFPESSGLMDTSQLTTGTGYKEVDGEMCQILYYNDGTHAEAGVIRNVDENGIGHVYDDEGNDTGYTVIVNTGGASDEKGNLYKDGEYKGNIYMLRNGPDKGELVVLNTTYLWLVYSDDDGQTWSDPVDITPQVKEDWMVFLGTGPGAGIQLQDGNLVFPVYSANTNVGASQSSAVIISEDHGETWKLGDSPQTLRGYDRETMTGGGMLTESQAVQLNDGRVLLFMRNSISNHVYMATSTDGGMTWDSIEEISELNEYYCQLSVIHYNKDDGEYLLLSNPNVSGRYDGWVHLGKVNEDGSISWEYAQQLNEGKFQYSCLSVLENDGENPVFGLLYEDDTDGSFDIKYTEFDENFVKAPLITEELSAPQIVDSSAEIDGTDITVTLTFDQDIMAVGTPKLELTLGSEAFEADYADGSGTETITFKGTLPEGVKGIVRAKGISLEEGLLENIRNKGVDETDLELYDLTRITEGLSIHDYSSQQSASTAPDTDGAAVNVLDGNVRTYWHSVWSDASYQLPQYVSVDLGETQEIYKVGYVGRYGNANGRIEEYSISVSTDGEHYTEVQRGTFQNIDGEQQVEFTPVEARYVRITAYSAYGNGGTQSCSMAEMMIYAYAEGVIEQGDLTALNELIASVQELDADTYSAVSWAALQDALEDALAISTSQDPVSQAMIDSARDALQDAADALVDITRVKDKLAEAEALDESDYTVASWAALQTVLAQAREQMDQATSSREVTDIVMRIENVMNALVEEVSDTASEAAVQALHGMVDKAVALGSDDAALNAAITAARTVLDKAAPTTTEVVTALLDLSEAMQALNTDESTDALRKDVQATIDFINENILNDVEGLRPGKVQALKDAVQAAQTLLDDPEATADALKAANKAMTKAAQELWEIVSKAELSALIEAANGYLDGDYTADSLEALQTAIESAQAVAANENATTAEVTEAITNLANAIAGLEVITLDTSALVHEIELVNEMLANIDNYVPSSVEGLADKLADAQNALENAASQAEIDEAVKALREARLSARTKADVSALEALIAQVNALDLRAYTLDSVVPVNRLMTLLTQAVNDPEITQAEADDLAAQMQAAIDQLQPVSEESTSAEGGAQTSDDASAADTSAAAQSGMFAAVLGAAAGMLTLMKRRKGQKR